MLERIDVISDVVCPWCMIGKRHLSAATGQWIARHPDQVPVVTWHAFELNPDLPVEGMDRQAYTSQKFGGPDRAREIYARVAAAGESAGIAFDFDAIRVQPNTFQAHRLITRAAAGARQDALVEALFGAYFLEGRDLTQDTVLADVAGESGQDRGDALAFLAGDALRDEVRAELRMAREIGVQGVPFFIFNQRLALSGAHPPEVLLAAMEEAASGNGA